MEKEDIYDRVIEMSRDIKYMREAIQDLKCELKEDREKTDKRLIYVEKTLQLNVGKISVIMIGIGAAIVGAIQLCFWLWDVMK